jgi:hypothetical protein
MYAHRRVDHVRLMIIQNALHAQTQVSLNICTLDNASKHVRMGPQYRIISV